MHRNEKGFTLMELMVVIVIVAILAAVAVPLYINYVKDAQRTEAKAAIGAIITAEQAYYLKSPDLLGTGVPDLHGDRATLETAGLLDIADARPDVGLHVDAATTNGLHGHGDADVHGQQHRSHRGRRTPTRKGAERALHALRPAAAAVDGGPPRAGAGPVRRLLVRGERGVGLMEVIVATIVAVVAILALAYTFGTGRGLVNRYEAARVALAAAQRRMEMLSAGPAGSADLQLGQHPAAGTVPGAGGRRDRGLRILDGRGLRRPGRRDSPRATWT